MEIREGKKVFHGIAIGKVRVFAKTENQVSRRKIEDTKAEIARFEDAKQKAIDELHALYEKALKEVGEVNAQIFDVHAMMLDDGDYIDSIHNLIEGQNVNAAYAVAQVIISRKCSRIWMMNISRHVPWMSRIFPNA